LYYPHRNYGKDEQRHKAFRQELYKLVTQYGGRFYLPYRRDYDPLLTLKAYPELEEAMAYKRELDPELRLNPNLFHHLGEK
jgi:FAD/FMN-containing dehydrogenase